jgi:hypothetical protein
MYSLFSKASGMAHDVIGAAIEVHKDKGLLESICHSVRRPTGLRLTSPFHHESCEPVEVSVDFSYDPDPAAICRYVDLSLGVGEHEQSCQID